MKNSEKNKIGFIYEANIGIALFYFVDFGEHIILHKKDEECKTYIIKKISDKGEIFIDRSIHNINVSISKGNNVVFREVEELFELNDGRPRSRITPISFFISDSLKYENFISGELCDEVNQTFVKNLYPLKDRFYISYIETQPIPFDLLKVWKK